MWKGIDVSDNQGVIDWVKVKATGVQFAILRSVRRSGKTDYQFAANLAGCRAQGIPVEVYKYTYATSQQETMEEARQVAALLQSHGLQGTRIWWDVEDRPTLQPLGKAALTACIKAGQAVIKAAGYQFGIYTGLYVYNEKWFDFGQFAEVPLWVARYPSSTEKTLEYTPAEKYKPNVGKEIWGWQYSSNGRIGGITGAVDLDICYMDPAQWVVPVPAKQRTVTANVLNIRKEPTASSEDIGDLIKGSVITVDRTENGWAHFEGWASEKYLK